MEDSKVSKSFCVLPWMHRYTNIGGEVQLCCLSEEFDNQIRDRWGKKIHIDQKSDSAKILNSPFMKEIRKQMLNGEWPTLCKRCRMTEKDGGKSRRSYENFAHKDKFKKYLDNTKPDGTLKKPQVETFDFRLGNVCNLACRMCTPRESTRWQKEWPELEIQLKGREVGSHKYHRYDKWYENPKVWKDFKKHLSTVTHLHLAGGEPLIINKTKEVIRLCVEENRASQIDVSFNTNLTRIDDEILEDLVHFKRVRFFASVDAYGKTNDYIRHPSRWEDIHQNILRLKATFTDPYQFELMVMSTVQIYNIFNLGELYDYLIAEHPSVCPFPQLINLYNDEFLRTQTLPEPLKELAIERMIEIQGKIQKYYKDYPEWEWRFSHLEPAVNQVINFIKSEDKSHHFPTFVRYTKALDRMRKNNVLDIIPELKDFMNWDQKQLNGDFDKDARKGFVADMLER